MFGIGMTEMIVIFVIALIVLGPKRLPELARTLGRTLAEFRRTASDLRREFSDVTDDAHVASSASIAGPQAPAEARPTVAEPVQQVQPVPPAGEKPGEGGPSVG